jgi:hypothetical protein
MLSKTRTTMIALVAAFSFAGASLVPTAAQAYPPDCAHFHYNAVSGLEMGNEWVAIGAWRLAAREYRMASQALSEYSRWC